MEDTKKHSTSKKRKLQKDEILEDSDSSKKTKLQYEDSTNDINSNNNRNGSSNSSSNSNSSNSSNNQNTDHSLQGYDAIISVDNPHIFQKYLSLLLKSDRNILTFYVTNNLNSGSHFQGLEIVEFNSAMTVAIDGRFEGSVFIYNSKNVNTSKFTINLKSLLTWISNIQPSDVLLFAIKDCTVSCIVRDSSVSASTLSLNQSNLSISLNPHLDLPLLVENEDAGDLESNQETAYEYMIEMNQGFLKSKIKTLRDLLVSQIEFALYVDPKKPIYYFVLRGIAEVNGTAEIPIIGTLQTSSKQHFHVNQPFLSADHEKTSKYLKYFDGKLLKIKVKHIIELLEPSIKINNYNNTNNNNHNNNNSGVSGSVSGSMDAVQNHLYLQQVQQAQQKSKSLVQNWNDFNLLIHHKIAPSLLDIFLRDFDRIKLYILLSKTHPVVFILSNGNSSQMKYAIAPMYEETTENTENSENPDTNYEKNDSD
jgi:hypothetical protein